jgi:peroxin-4
MNTLKRLRKEQDEISRNPSDSDLQLESHGDNLMKWNAMIRGPKDSAYDGYLFKLSIDVSDRYPIVPPKITFLTKIFHPNILYATGEICLDVLKHDWTPAWSLTSALRAIAAILSEPNADSPLNCDAGNMIRSGDMVAFRSMARMYAVEFAEEIPAAVLEGEAHK